MIRQPIRAGLSVIKAKIERDGKFVSKAGKMRKRLCRPGAEADKLDWARQELAKGTGIIKTAKLTGPWHRHGAQAQAADGKRRYVLQARQFGSS